ncbi:MAG: serine/threonine protein kinase [Candidatus Coatesbacteria bacterium]|nr:serine/threonine protein kinase [Candidatus Coatesbacteria bacterium]
MENQTTIQNRYRLGKRLGRESGGTTGMVYEAQDLQIDQKVVVRILRPVFASDRELIRELRKSIDAIGAIKHPAIVRYRDFIVSGDQVAIVSDFVGGLTLEETIEKSGPLSPEASKRYMLQLCSAMHTSHSQGLGHYDLTPRNVMFSSDGELHLCDFGVSRLLKDWLLHSSGGRKASGVESSRLTECLAPEQKSYPIYSISCDIYAAGILFNMMQTGKAPELSGQPRRAARRAEFKGPEAGAFITSPEQGPSSLDYIVRKAVNPKHWQRWETFIIMSYALEGRIQPKMRPSDSTTLAAMPSLRGKLLRKRTIGFILVAIMLLGAILGIAKLISMIPKDVARPREALTEYLSDDLREDEDKSEIVVVTTPTPDPGVHIAKAKDFIANGDLDSAEKEAKAVLASKGDPSAAAELLKIIQKQRTIRTLIQKAKEHIEGSELTEAGVLLDQVVEIEPENTEVPDLRLKLGRLQKIASLIENATDAFDKKFYTTPENESAYHYAQKTLEEDPGNEEAKAIVGKIIATYTRIADAFFDASDYGKAAFYYGKVLKLEKTNAHAAERIRTSRERKASADAASEQAEAESQPDDNETTTESTAVSSEATPSTTDITDDTD